MIRAAYHPIVFTVLLTVAAPAFAQEDTAPATAVQEAVRRQARTVELRQKLIEAGQAEQRKDAAAAAKLYQAAYGLVQSIGSGIDAEAKAAVGGLSRISVAIVQDLQAQGNYSAADTRLRAALKVDPQNQTLLALKRNNDGLQAQQAGKIPSPEVQDLTAGVAASKIKNATKVQDAKLLYELGKWDDAEVRLKQVLAEEPENAAAIYYIKLLQDARYGASDSLRELNARKQLVEVENIWQPSVKRDLLPVPNPYYEQVKKTVHTGSGRQEIISKLDRIRLSEVKYDGLDLSEVIRNLSEISRKSDPDKVGINFMLIGEAGSAAPAPSNLVDPTTGLPVAATPTEAVDIGTIRVKINPAMNNLRLADVLDAIVRTAEKPIKFSIEDYAVVFSTRTPEPETLYTRTFRLDPNTFMQGLEGVSSTSFGSSGGSSGGGGRNGGGGGGRNGGGNNRNNNNNNNNNGGGDGGDSSASIAKVSIAGGSSNGRNGNNNNNNNNRGGRGGANGNSSGGGIKFLTTLTSIEEAQEAAINFFRAAGVDFSEPANNSRQGGPGGPGGANNAAANGKTLFFNDRKGVLFVRATLRDLDIIEAAIQTLNVTPPQVTIQSKIAEVTQDDRKSLGVNWFLGNTLMGDGALGVQGGTAPTFNGTPSLANPAGQFPNPPIAQSVTDTLITGGLRNGLNAPAIGTLTGILTDPQFRVVVNALEQRDGVDVVSAPSVTTLSGRQTHIEVTDILSIVTDLETDQTSGGGNGNNNNNGNNGNGGGGAVGSTLTPIVEQLPFGPSLDVLPSVSADEYSIQMTIIPTVTEFVGYDTSSFTAQAQGTTGNALVQQVPLPRFRVRQVVTSVVVWDGQTVVLGGLISEAIIKTKDKVPVLGDLPLLGRWFRSESASKKKKNLLIFVTPTIIDPAGNRIHTDEDMPFAQTTVPQQASPQRPVAVR